MAIGILATLATGCAGGRATDWLRVRKDSRYYLDLALEGQTPDERREGVIGLAKGRDATATWAVKVFDTIARTDTDAMVRCAAIRGMATSCDPERVPTLLKLLGSATKHLPDVRPASAPIRWEAAKLLLQIVDAHAYDESQRQAMVEGLLDRVTRDDDRNVRLTAIDTLAYFAQRPVPAALVDAMQAEEDFALQHSAEEALIALTGRTHHHDPVAWRAWLAETDDPFEHAGQTPEELQAQGGKPWWRWNWD